MKVDIKFGLKQINDWESGAYFVTNSFASFLSFCDFHGISLVIQYDHEETIETITSLSSY